jgi:hypothetical protein
VYAFTTPITSPMLHGGSPKPVQTPPMLQLDEVTYGYVPEIDSESGTDRKKPGCLCHNARILAINVSTKKYTAEPLLPGL